MDIWKLFKKNNNKIVLQISSTMYILCTSSPLALWCSLCKCIIIDLRQPWYLINKVTFYRIIIKKVIALYIVIQSWTMVALHLPNKWQSEISFCHFVGFSQQTNQRKCLLKCCPIMDHSPSLSTLDLNIQRNSLKLPIFYRILFNKVTILFIVIWLWSIHAAVICMEHYRTYRIKKKKEIQ